MLPKRSVEVDVLALMARLGSVQPSPTALRALNTFRLASATRAVPRTATAAASGARHRMARPSGLPQEESRRERPLARDPPKRRVSRDRRGDPTPEIQGLRTPRDPVRSCEPRVPRRHRRPRTARPYYGCIPTPPGRGQRKFPGSTARDASDPIVFCINARRATGSPRSRNRQRRSRPAMPDMLGSERPIDAPGRPKRPNLVEPAVEETWHRRVAGEDPQDQRHPRAAASSSAPRSATCGICRSLHRSAPTVQRGNARPRSRQQVSLGLDVGAGWKPTWEIIDTKAKVVRELRMIGRNGTVYLYLATDREGEGEGDAGHAESLVPTEFAWSGRTGGFGSRSAGGVICSNWVYSAWSVATA